MSPDIHTLLGDVLDLQQWCTDHSHGDIHARLEVHSEMLRLMLERVAKLEQLCEQCYLESKGEGP